MLQIRDVAARIRVSTHTLRYYERAGLLAPTVRSAAGYRLYSDDAVRRVRLLRVLRGLGFGVRELRGIAGVLDGRFPRQPLRARLRSKRDEIGALIADLERSWKLLEALQSCRCRGDCVLVTRFLDGGVENLPAGCVPDRKAPASAKKGARR
jgi:DNA-binding transcriptional MerR regulator